MPWKRMILECKYRRESEFNSIISLSFSPHQSDSCVEGTNRINLRSAELFGCPDGIEPNIPDLPLAMSANWATLLPDESGVMVCGGFECNYYDNDWFNVMDECFLWRPDTNVWLPAEFMVKGK